MTTGDLTALGYTPSRQALDMRLSEQVTVLNTTSRQNQIVPTYKIFSKSYCSGCNPIAELGFGTCNLSMLYNPRTQLLTIKSTNVIGSDYQLAVLVAQTAFGSASHYVKTIAIVFSLGGYLASRRTVQWKEVDLHNADSILSKVIHTFSPKCFPYPSKSLRFDMFCYNSDIFVFLFAGGVLLDMQNCLLYMRHLDIYNAPTPSLSYTLQLYSLTTRLLWFNCAILKAFKIAWNLISSATFTGESKIMAFFNLSNVASLYLSAALLTYVPAYIEYSNSVRLDQSHQDESLDAIFIDSFDSYYLRTIPSIVIGVIANIIFITTLDHLWNRRKWSLLEKNSLARQALFNSSSILCDYLDDVEKEIDGERVAAVIHCKARRLCTLQWFLTNHLICFGLPEKELRMKKRLLQSSISTTVPTTSNTTIKDDPQDSKYTIAQDSDHHIHLLDSQVVDVTSLVLNIKVLKDTIQMLLVLVFVNFVLGQGTTTRNDRGALKMLYWASGGPNWRRQWPVGDLLSDPCMNGWYGVHCNFQAKIIAIRLSNNGLTGYIPPAFARLKELEELDLSTNSLSQELPTSLSSLSSLVILKLNHNSFTGVVPSEIALIPNLLILSLEVNQFQNPMPLTVYNLQSKVLLTFDPQLMPTTFTPQ
ncbi:hypothetical protein THRCLA_10250 [Thraustotheca clavata]|uniref:Leucine-rich repeat-containing N-terminal plant-type domain-containing protein n=1 Tax=Thraustotheca clavata TaxID=74557 RepID=A0A1V9YS27_9STRA|nr:hypothetical protein THRCLA_10250 [Thraustotheca clavata]